jgi:hypothetical protein
MKIMMGDFSLKVGMEGIFKLIIRNESPYDIGNEKS